VFSLKHSKIKFSKKTTNLLSVINVAIFITDNKFSCVLTELILRIFETECVYCGVINDTLTLILLMWIIW
jgi:hypothetical protein